MCQYASSKCNYLPCVNRQMCKLSLWGSHGYLPCLPLCTRVNTALGCTRSWVKGNCLLSFSPFVTQTGARPSAANKLVINTLSQLKSHEGWWKEVIISKWSVLFPSPNHIEKWTLRDIYVEPGKQEGARQIHVVGVFVAFLVFSFWIHSLHSHADTSGINH